MLFPFYHKQFQPNHTFLRLLSGENEATVQMYYIRCTRTLQRTKAIEQKKKFSRQNTRELRRNKLEKLQST